MNFRDYSNYKPEGYTYLRGDYTFTECLDDAKELIIYRLELWKQENLDYFTCGEVEGINKTIEMIASGKV